MKALGACHHQTSRNYLTAILILLGIFTGQEGRILLSPTDRTILILVMLLTSKGNCSSLLNTWNHFCFLCSKHPRGMATGVFRNLLHLPSSLSSHKKHGEKGVRGGVEWLTLHRQSVPVMESSCCPVAYTPPWTNFSDHYPISRNLWRPRQTETAP